MAFNIFEPQISQVTAGLEGKMILIYGTNRTGKTLNAVKAEKPFVFGFERGLNAIPGIPFAPISTWRQFTEIVKQFTGPQMDKAKETYKTLIIDTIDAMGDLAAEYVCGVFNCDSVGTGKGGYGIWKEYAAEINKWLRTLTNAGYTIVFIGHEGTREKQDERGAKYDQIYPRGEKRVVDPICDLVDFICYAQMPPRNEKDIQPASTLYMTGTRAFHAGSRFTEVTDAIPEWNIDKLTTVIAKAVEAEEKKSGIKAVSFEENQKNLEKANTSPWADKSTADLRAMCVEKGGASINATGTPEWYQTLLFDLFGTREFVASKATEQQRPQLEQLLEALIAAGY